MNGELEWSMKEKNVRNTEHRMSNKKFKLFEELTGYDATQMPRWTESYRGSFAMTKDLQKKLSYIKQELKLPAYMVVSPFVNNLYKKLKRYNSEEQI